MPAATATLKRMSELKIAILDSPVYGLASARTPEAET